MDALASRKRAAGDCEARRKRAKDVESERDLLRNLVRETRGGRSAPIADEEIARMDLDKLGANIRKLRSRRNMMKTRSRMKQGILPKSYRKSLGLEVRKLKAIRLAKELADLKYEEETHIFTTEEINTIKDAPELTALLDRLYRYISTAKKNARRSEPGGCTTMEHASSLWRGAKSHDTKMRNTKSRVFFGEFELTVEYLVWVLSQRPEFRPISGNDHYGCVLNTKNGFYNTLSPDRIFNDWSYLFWNVWFVPGVINSGRSLKPDHWQRVPERQWGSWPKTDEHPVLQLMRDLVSDDNKLPLSKALWTMARHACESCGRRGRPGRGITFEYKSYQYCVDSMVAFLWQQGMRGFYGGIMFDVTKTDSPFFPSLERLDSQGDYVHDNNAMILSGFNGSTGARAANLKRKGAPDEVVAEQAALNRAPISWWRELCGFSTPGLAEHVASEIALDYAFVRSRMTPRMLRRFDKPRMRTEPWGL